MQIIPTRTPLRYKNQYNNDLQIKITRHKPKIWPFKKMLTLTKSFQQEHHYKTEITTILNYELNLQILTLTMEKSFHYPKSFQQEHHYNIKIIITMTYELKLHTITPRVFFRRTLQKRCVKDIFVLLTCEIDFFSIL